jgi:hypothetical protein
MSASGTSTIPTIAASSPIWICMAEYLTAAARIRLGPFTSVPCLVPAL